jgi:hypothetical protein
VEDYDMDDNDEVERFRRLLGGAAGVMHEALAGAAAAEGAGAANVAEGRVKPQGGKSKSFRTARGQGKGGVMDGSRCPPPSRPEATADCEAPTPPTPCTPEDHELEEEDEEDEEDEEEVDEFGEEEEEGIFDGGGMAAKLGTGELSREEEVAFLSEAAIREVVNLSERMAWLEGRLKSEVGRREELEKVLGLLPNAAASSSSSSSSFPSPAPSPSPSSASPTQGEGEPKSRRRIRRRDESSLNYAYSLEGHASLVSRLVRSETHSNQLDAKLREETRLRVEMQKS